MTFVRKAIDIVITLIIVVSVVSAFFWFVYTFDVFKLPSFIADIFDRDQRYADSEVTLDDDLLKLLETEEYIDEEYSCLLITPEKAKKLLSSVLNTDSYYWIVETVVKYGDASRIQRHSVYKKGDSVRIDTEEEDSRVTNIFSDERNVVIDNVTGEINEFSGDTDFSYSNIVNIAALDYLFDGNVAVENIALLDADEDKYLYVEVPKKNINGTDKYFISLSCGIVMYASSTIDGEEYFTQKTISFDDTVVMLDDAFTVTYSETGELLTLQ